MCSMPQVNPDWMWVKSWHKQGTWHHEDMRVKPILERKYSGKGDPRPIPTRITGTSILKINSTNTYHCGLVLLSITDCSQTPNEDQFSHRCEEVYERETLDAIWLPCSNVTKHYLSKGTMPSDVSPRGPRMYCIYMYGT